MNHCYVRKCLFEIPVLVHSYRFILKNIYAFCFGFKLLIPLTYIPWLRSIPTCRYKCKEVNSLWRPDWYIRIMLFWSGTPLQTFKFQSCSHNNIVIYTVSIFLDILYGPQLVTGPIIYPHLPPPMLPHDSPVGVCWHKYYCICNWNSILSLPYQPKLSPCHLILHQRTDDLGCQGRA